jgi:tetraacyldisaccharide-1-P 4'-kinase
MCELKIFSDHHHYTFDDLSQLQRAAQSASADVVLTTLKDAVKIPAESWTGPPLYAIEIGVDVLNGSELLMDHLQRVLAYSLKAES